MADKEKNKQSLKEAVNTLNQIAASPSTPKTIKKTITDLIAELQSAEHAISVRAANAISTLDDITQDPNMPSYVRVTLWQAVSKLEGIRD